MARIPSEDIKAAGLTQSVDPSKIKNFRTRDAIQFALAGEWNEAIFANREILNHFPEDLETLNRLGKAHLELGKYSEARGSFEKVLSLSRHNRIAKRNLERISYLEAKPNGSHAVRKATPRLFLEDSGKSGITILRNQAARSVLAKVAAGDPVNIKLYHNTLMVQDTDSDILGYVEPKLGSRLARFIQQGNVYGGIVLSVSHDKISVIIRETYQHPTLSGVSSFPTAVRDQYRSSFRDAILRYDIESESEEDDEEEPIAMWTEDGDEATTTLPSRSSRSRARLDDETDDDE